MVQIVLLQALFSSVRELEVEQLMFRKLFRIFFPLAVLQKTVSLMISRLVILIIVMIVLHSIQRKQETKVK